MTAHHEQAARFGEVILERLKYGVSEIVPRRMVEDMRVDVCAEITLDALLVQLRTYVLADRLPPRRVAFPVRGTYSHRVPAGPWQLFKAMNRHRWFMRWRTWRVVETPAVEVEFAVDVYADLREAWTWPNAAIKLPPDFGAARLHVEVAERGAFLPTLDEVRDRRYR